MNDNDTAGGIPILVYKEKHLPAGNRDTSALVVSYPNYRDPLIGINRVIFKINDVAYRLLLIPLSKGYTRLLPDPVERSIGNFFYNIKTATYAVNHLLQRNPKPMGRTLQRFGINTTVGLLGFFDPALTQFGLEREETHFDDTLSHYGAGYGIYLVAPLLGATDARSATSSVFDYFSNPISYLTDRPLSTAINGFDNLQDFSPHADEYEKLRNESDDPYIFFRNLHLQGVRRDAEYRKN